MTRTPMTVSYTHLDVYKRQGYAIGTPEGISVRCGKGILLLTEVQLEGGKRMDARAFLMGHPMDCAEELR